MTSDLDVLSVGCGRGLLSVSECVVMMADSIMDLTTRRPEAVVSGKPRAAKSVFSIRSLVEVEDDAAERRTSGKFYR